MADITKLIMPQINVNDSDALLRNWTARPGEHVEAGTILASIETSKATVELTAPCSGFFFPLVAKDARYKTGVELAVISTSPDYAFEPPPVSGPKDNNADVLLTKKARELVEKLGLPLDALPQNVLLKEKDILTIADQIKPSSSSMSFERLERYIEHFCASGEKLSNAILIVGAGTTAKIVIDTIRLLPEYRIFGIVDMNYSEEQANSVLGVPVIGKDSVEVLEFLYQRGITTACNSVASLQNLRAREAVFQKLKAVGFTLPCIIHPTAFVEKSAVLEESVFVHAHAYVGSEAHIGHNTFLNTGAIVSHDCDLGHSVFCAPNSTLAGTVTVEDCTLVGMCVTILFNVRIGSDVVLTNGCRVFNDVADKLHIM